MYVRDRDREGEWEAMSYQISERGRPYSTVQVAEATTMIVYKRNLKAEQSDMQGGAARERLKKAIPVVTADDDAGQSESCWSEPSAKQEGSLFRG